MDVSLPPELEKRIAEKIASGQYASADEVVREAVRLLFAVEGLHDRQLERLRAEIRVGLDQLDRGESIPAEQVFEELRELLGKSFRSRL